MQQPGASQYAAIAMTAPSAAVHAAAPVQAVTPVAGKENLTCTAPPATKPVASAADTTDLLGKLMQQQLASSSTPGQVRLADKAAGMQGKGSGRKLVQSRLCFGTRSGVTPWTAARPKEDAGLRGKGLHAHTSGAATAARLSILVHGLTSFSRCLASSASAPDAVRECPSCYGREARGAWCAGERS